MSRPLLLASLLLASLFPSTLLCARENQVPLPDLEKVTTHQLLGCFANWRICGVGENQASGWPISDELARRGDPHPLLVAYWKEHRWLVRDGIEHVAYHFDTPEVTAFMRRIVAHRIYDGEDRYYPVNYLAKHCDPDALKLLSSGRYRRSLGCMQYESSLKLFGKCKYRPAIAYLAGTALYDYCGNDIDSAQQSLHELYPDSPTDFPTINDLQHYFCRRAKQDGFAVDCSTK